MLDAKLTEYLSEYCITEVILKKIDMKIYRSDKT